MSALESLEATELDLRLEPTPWAFAQSHADAIAANWRSAVAEKPALFNGRVLLLGRRAFEQTGSGAARMTGAFFEADFSAFIAWKALGFPGPAVENCFSMAALRSSDGAFLLGEMAAHTYNAGQIYFAAGTPDLDDVFGDRVDLDASARRELAEETGVMASEATVAPGWTILIAPGRVACMKAMVLPLAAEAAAARIEAWLARDPQAEFSRMHIVRASADIDDERTPPFVAAYIRAELSRSARDSRDPMRQTALICTPDLSNTS